MEKIIEMYKMANTHLRYDLGKNKSSKCQLHGWNTESGLNKYILIDGQRIVKVLPNGEEISLTVVLDNKTKSNANNDQIALDEYGLRDGFPNAMKRDLAKLANGLRRRH